MTINRSFIPAIPAGCTSTFGGYMIKLIALSLAVAAVATTASAQGTYQTTTQATPAKAKTHGTMKRHKAKAETEESAAALQKEAKITEPAARATALKEVPTGTVKKFELERENGKLIYSYDISVPGKTGIEEVAINAIDGTIVTHEHETPKAEKAEAAKEAKEKKAKK
jgi:uncharacterized membrane protein YkoI